MSPSSTKLCEHCDKPIPGERLEALPRATTCVDCSTEQPYTGYMVYPHKTGGYAEVLRTSDPERLRQARRADRRSR